MPVEGSGPKCLFVGGSADGKRMRVDPDLVEIRRTQSLYVRRGLRLFVEESLKRADLIGLLIDGYRPESVNSAEQAIVGRLIASARSMSRGLDAIEKTVDSDLNDPEKLFAIKAQVVMVQKELEANR